MAIEQGIFWVPHTPNSLLILEGVEFATGTRDMERENMLIVACNTPVIVRRLAVDRGRMDHTVKVPDELTNVELAALRRLGVNITSADFRRQMDSLRGFQWHITGGQQFPALDPHLRRQLGNVTQPSLFS